MPPKNVSLTECFNASKDYGDDKKSASALHAGVPAKGGVTGDWRAEGSLNATIRPFRIVALFFRMPGIAGLVRT